MHLVRPSCEAPEVVPYVPNILVIKAMLPKNVGIVVKPWTQVEGHARDVYTGHGRRLFRRADGDLLVFMGVKETLYECSTRQVCSGMLGGPHQTSVSSKYVGYWTRLFPETTCDVTEMFEKDTQRHPRKTPGACTSEEARHREVDQGAIDTREYSALFGQDLDDSGEASPVFSHRLLGCSLRNHPRDKKLHSLTQLYVIEAKRTVGRLRASKTLPYMGECQVRLPRTTVNTVLGHGKV
ncbi:hypothetical protein HPB50_010082 [Hyalomma asiaticum]|uniref:Uncharacterized protein n=1 Tax=Hyalomma asiaticum TaxID=266040 RepID=A0ACB7TFW5_HYAAI|nr:hypothetical protein HPB50_010082 [Hyalomma asiaticum]